MAKVIYKGPAKPDNPIYTGELFIGARITGPAETRTVDKNPEVQNDVGILTHRDHRFWSIVTSHSGGS